MVGTDKPFASEDVKSTKVPDKKPGAGSSRREQTESVRNPRVAGMRQSRPLNDNMMKDGFYDAEGGNDEDIFAHLSNDLTE